MTRPPVEVPTILRDQGDCFREQNRSWLGYQQLNVLRAISACRTAALGGHLDSCSRCDLHAISYNFVPQPALPEVSGAGAPALVGKTRAGPAPRTLFPCRLHSASRVESAMSAASSATLRSALPRLRPDHS